MLKLILLICGVVMQHSAAFGRLCVETLIDGFHFNFLFSAAFGRLCVETSVRLIGSKMNPVSRLRAAVC